MEELKRMNQPNSAPPSTLAQPIQPIVIQCELPQAIDAERMEKAQIVLQTVMTGLTDIQKIYPNLIRIQKEEWRQADAYDESSALRS